MSELLGLYLHQLLVFLVVSLLWGATNPFLKQGCRPLGEPKRGQSSGFFSDWRYLLTNYQYLVPWLVNLSGSVVYYIALGDSDISLATPITNSLTFVFTLATGRLLGERIPGNVYFGMALVVSGITLCVLIFATFTVTMGLNELVLSDSSDALGTVLYIPQLVLALVGLLQMFKQLPEFVSIDRDRPLATSEYLKHNAQSYLYGFVLSCFSSWMIARYANYLEQIIPARLGSSDAHQDSETRDRAEKGKGAIAKLLSCIWSLVKKVTFPFTLLAQYMKYFMFLWICHMPFFYFGYQELLFASATPIGNIVWFMAFMLFCYYFSFLNVAYWVLTSAGVYHFWTYLKYTQFRLSDNVLIDLYYAIVHHILPGVIDLFSVKFGYYIVLTKWAWQLFCWLRDTPSGADENKGLASGAAIMPYRADLFELGI